MTKLNIAVVNHQVEIGGAEVALLRLAEALRGRHDLSVFLPGDGPLPDALCDLGVGVARVHVPGGSLAARRNNSAGLLLRVLVDGPRWRRTLGVLAEKLTKADVVVTGSTKAHLYGGWAARRAGRPLIWWLHDTVDRTSFGRLSRSLIRAGARRLPDRILAVSRTSASSLQLPRADSRLRVVYNGIEPVGAGRDTAGAFRSGCPRVGWIGRLIPSKGPEAFLEASARVAGRIPDVSFLVVGGGDSRDSGYGARLETMAGDSGMSDRVEFAGFRPDLEGVFRSLDVLVFTSVASESLPNVVLEAMANGVPVVAFSGGGVDEIAGDSGGVLRVPPGDVDALAEAVSGLLERAQERRDLALRGAARIRETFGWNRWVDAWERELVTLVAERESR